MATGQESTAAQWRLTAFEFGGASRFWPAGSIEGFPGGTGRAAGKG